MLRSPLSCLGLLCHTRGLHAGHIGCREFWAEDQFSAKSQDLGFGAWGASRICLSVPVDLIGCIVMAAYHSATLHCGQKVLQT